MGWIVGAAARASCTRAGGGLSFAAMSEQTLWQGHSSQVKNFWPFVACLLVLPIPWAIYRWLEVKTTTYKLTTERLIVERGILSKTTDTLELYRVRDLQTTQPFWTRLFGLENVHLLTADTTTPSRRAGGAGAAGQVPRTDRSLPSREARAHRGSGRRSRRRRRGALISRR